MTSRTNTKNQLSTINVSIPVLKRVSLPVSVDFTEVPSGISTSSLRTTYSVNSLNAGILDNSDVTEAKLGKIDFSDLKPGVNTVYFDVSDIPGILPLDSVNQISATVTIPNTYEEIKVPLSTADVSVVGVAEGYEAEVTDLSNSSITVIAPVGTKPASIKLTAKCNVSEENEEGEYPLQLSLKNSYCWVYSTYTATVELTEE